MKLYSLTDNVGLNITVEHRRIITYSNNNKPIEYLNPNLKPFFLNRKTLPIQKTTNPLQHTQPERLLASCDMYFISEDMKLAICFYYFSGVPGNNAVIWYIFNNYATSSDNNIITDMNITNYGYTRTKVTIR